MSQYPPTPPTPPTPSNSAWQAAAHQPPPIPLPLPRTTLPSSRGPIGGPLVLYQPQMFHGLYLWFAVLLAIGLGTSITIVGLVIGIPCIIAAMVLQYILLYRAWNQIQDGYQRTGPDTAVGLCFVPFFNFYWFFVAYVSLARDLNAYTRRYAINAPRVSDGLATAFAILLCAAFIPYLGFLIMIGVAAVSFFLMHQIKTASAAIAYAKSPMPLPPTPPSPITFAPAVPA